VAVGGGNRLLTSRAPPQAELNVGLAGADPHLVNKDVVQFDLVLDADGHAVGLAIGRYGRQNDLPVTLRVGLGGDHGIVQPDRHVFTGIGPTPDRQRPLSLQYHVAAEHFG
jgi:hypothetical protein